jgi:hypothetical protein
MIIPHESSRFLKSRNFLPIATRTKYLLSSRDAISLSNALGKDSEGYLYNGILSIGTGIQSILNNNYGWATVKFYYSVFYLARANLGVHNICIVYDGSKPFSIISKPGELLQKRKGTTHKLVLDQFKQNLSANIMLGNDINGKCPFSFMMEQRELMNYRSAVMSDPNIPEQYKEIINSNKKIRQWLNIYLSDNIEVYTFDEEHACLAYPFKFLIHTIEMFKNNSMTCRYLKKNSSFIRRLFSDGSGDFDFILKKFDEF